MRFIQVELLTLHSELKSVYVEMRIIKKLHWFVLKSFLPLFAMTFFIVLFIVLMQFLWKYIDELVGKGLSVDVLGELFFYAAVSMVPMALPLAILLASLMTFGNLGEKFELTAMKASGISLLRVMAPLIWFIGIVAVGAFFFQNNVLPTAQVKMWTLLFSMKQKSPELEIPEGVFYDQIPGYNLFVKHKNIDTGVLHDVIIYDVGNGGDNATILTSDSARLAFTKDNKYLYLHLYEGEQFENLREQTTFDNNVSFRRENFFDKQVLIPFDANFNRMDDNAMRKQYVGKNISELRHTIDSVNRRVDSVGAEYGQMLKHDAFRIVSSTEKKVVSMKSTVKLNDPFSIDSLIMSLPEYQRRQLVSHAIAGTIDRSAEYEFKAANMDDDKRTIRRHEIELLKKYTLSVACMIMFFIGAPLGAIIRKGGLGTPLVISVLLFLVYYIIDNTGYKMARDGRWIVWMGMWVSTAILAPLGIYVTWKAMNDSAVFDKDLYMNYLRKILGRRQERRIEYKEVIINDVPMSEALRRMTELRDYAGAAASRLRTKMSYSCYWLHGISTERLKYISDMLENNVALMTDCRNPMAVNKLMDYPVIRSLWIYHPSGKRWLGYTMMILFPLGIPVWILALRSRRRLRDEMQTVSKVSADIIGILKEDNRNIQA